MSCMKTSLFKEPTVEIVDPAVVLSNTCVLKVGNCRMKLHSHAEVHQCEHSCYEERS